MAPRTSFDVDSLATAIPAVFDQAQASAATHKKNCVALYKLHSAASEVVESVNRGRKDAEIRLAGERTFVEVFMDMLNRVLVVRKSTPAADRIVKFVASFVKFLNEKADSEEDETPASRFVSRLLKYFLKGFQVKSKEVRSRCLHFVSDIVCNLGELDQVLYAELRAALLERLADKESLVRVYAVSALSILASSEDPYDLEDDEPPIISSLVETLFYDPAAEVRRAALVHIPFNPATLPSLLTRMRDVDALTRKLVFSVVLPRFANPRQLTIAQREQVVSHGLGDRTEAVRVAAGKLLASWVDACEGDLATFVSLFDLYDPDIARNALKSVFVSRTNVVDEIEFDENFWSNLRPETALLARSFVEHCIDNHDETRLEATLPVVTAVAFRLQTAYNHYLATLEQINDKTENENEDNDTREERVANAALVMGELLRVAVHLDYSDEIGRRKMFGVVRNLLAHPELPESLIEASVGVLHIISPNERDLIRIIVEIISELRDSVSEIEGAMGTEDDGESTFSTARPDGTSRSRSRKNISDMSPEEKMEADMTDLRCLSLCIAILGRIHGSFEENSTLRGILEDLIVPSVQRKELALRERGLMGLGLCCLIAKNMALSSFQLFLSQVKSSPESLRLKVLQVVFDIMMTYEKDLFESAESIGERVVTFLMQVLEAEESNRVQALMCLGLSKLMLFGLVTDERILMSLIFAYVSPTNADNQELRQCLAYFLPVYCYSSSVNQARLQSVFVKTMQLIFQAYEELDDDQDMITPLQFGQLLVDWTNPSKVVGADGKEDLPAIHVHLAVDLVRALYDNEQSVESRKTLTMLLSNLALPNAVDQKLLYTLYILLYNLTEVVPFEDSATDKAFLRFKTRLEKHFAETLVDYDEQACFNDPESTYNEVFEFLGITRPQRRRFERRSGAENASKGTGPLHDDDASEADGDVEARAPESLRSGPRRMPRPKPRSVNGKKAASLKDTPGSDSSGDEEKLEQGMAIVAPSRTRRTVATYSVVPGSEASSDSGDGTEEVSDVELRAEDKENVPLPSTPPRKRGTKRLHTPTKSPSVISPMAKRQTRGAKKGKPTEREMSNVATEALTNGTNKLKSARAPPKLKTLAEETEGINAADEDDEESSAASEASIPQRRKQTIRSRAPHPMSQLLDEEIGWDSSSDI